MGRRGECFGLCARLEPAMGPLGESLYTDDTLFMLYDMGGLLSTLCRRQQGWRVARYV